MTFKKWIFALMMPHWTSDRIADDQHPHRRRFTVRYRRKQGIVKNIWIGSGLLMALQSTPAIIFAIALATTFLSFVILDETP